MPDRYEDATESLRGVAPPDQWNEITERAKEPDSVVRLDAPSTDLGRRRRGPRIAVAALASAAALAGAVWLLQDDGDDTSVISQEPPAEDPEGEMADWETPCDTNYFRGVFPELSVAGPAPADPDDPRVPEAVRPDLAGVYDDPATGRAIFLLTGHPDIPYDHSASYPVNGNLSQPDGFVAPYADGWLAQLDFGTVTEGPCPITILGVGLEEADFVEFVEQSGLSVHIPTACSPGNLLVGNADMPIFGDVADPDPNDPRLPEAALPHLVGVVNSDTTTRALFILEGFPDIGADQSQAYQADLTIFEPGRQATVAPIGDGWTAQIDYVTDDEEGCPLTLVGIGLNESDFLALIDNTVMPAG